LSNVFPRGIQTISCIVILALRKLDSSENCQFIWRQQCWY